MSAPFYATVEQLQASTDYKTTAFEADRLRRILDAASRQIEQRLHRHFYPLTEAVTFIDPPSVILRRVTTAGFMLDKDLLALTAATEDGTAATVSSVELYPRQFGPPYSWLGLTGSTIVVTGRWGYSEVTATAGALAAAIADTTGTSVDCSDSSLIGIGDLIKADSEQMVVTAKLQLDSAQNTSGALTEDVSDDTVGLTDGTAFNVGETLTIESERMLLVDITGNNGLVKRAYDGSVLAAHDTAKDIYVPRTLTVERGAAGTTAATHSDAAAIVKNVPPAPIVDLCLAEAITTYEQESAGYGRTVGSGENQREARGSGIFDLRKLANSYRRTRGTAI